MLDLMPEHGPIIAYDSSFSAAKFPHRTVSWPASTSRLLGTVVLIPISRDHPELGSHRSGWPTVRFQLL